MKKKLLVTILAMTVMLTSVNPPVVYGEEASEQDVVQSAGESEELVEEDVYGEDEEEDDDEEDWGELDENGFVIKDGDHYTDTTTIYCSKGSTAEAYALAHNIPFVYFEDAVSKTPTITVSAGISIEKTAGDAAFSLGVSTDSDGKVTYSSDNENVVKVDSNGNVAVMGAGTANIIIKTAKTAKYEAAEQKVTIMVKEKTNNAGTTGKYGNTG